jgi:divinyl chlorophyllide a 8-vinyl-reductase
LIDDKENDMAYSTITNIDRDKAQQRTQQLRNKVLAIGNQEGTYTTGKAGQGQGQYVLVLGGTGYIGKALVPELVDRGYKPVVMSRSDSAKKSKEFAGADIFVGDVSNIEDVRKVFDAFRIEGVITLLSSRRPNDEEECYKVDYQSNMNAITVAAERGARHFIHISDYGVYRPELLPQVYKLQIEGELIGQHFGKLNYSIVRPTAYFPYIAMNYSDIKHGAAYQLLDHGEYNLFNPIAREDLAEFIVNLLFDETKFSRLFPVGGPWTADNVGTIKSAGEIMFGIQGIPEKYKVVTLKSWDKRIANLRFMGKFMPMFKRVAFYLEAAKYWSVVSHVAPPYGRKTFTDFVKQLKEINYDAGTFRDRMKSGTSLTPDI